MDCLRQNRPILALSKVRDVYGVRHLVLQEAAKTIRDRVRRNAIDGGGDSSTAKAGWPGSYRESSSVCRTSAPSGNHPGWLIFAVSSSKLGKSTLDMCARSSAG